MSSNEKCEVVFVNYTWCKNVEDQMDVLLEYRSNVLSADSDYVDVIVDFTGQYASIEFIKQATEILEEVQNRINKFVVVGTADMQKLSILAVNAITGASIEMFDKLDEVPAYLGINENELKKIIDHY